MTSLPLPVIGTAGDAIVVHRCPPGPLGVAGGPTTCTRANPPTFTRAQERRVLRVADAWPYGPNVCGAARNALVDWALAHDLRLSHSSRRDGLDWLVGNAPRGRVARWWAIDSRLHGNPLDHVTRWTRDGRPALLLAQPYTSPTPEWIAAAKATWPVRVQVTDRAPWYGHGTYGVLITPRPEAH